MRKNLFKRFKTVLQWFTWLDLKRKKGLFVAFVTSLDMTSHDQPWPFGFVISFKKIQFLMVTRFTWPVASSTWPVTSLRRWWPKLVTKPTGHEPQDPVKIIKFKKLFLPALKTFKKHFGLSFYVWEWFFVQKRYFRNIFEDIFTIISL